MLYPNNAFTVNFSYYKEIAIPTCYHNIFNTKRERRTVETSLIRTSKIQSPLLSGQLKEGGTKLYMWASNTFSQASSNST